MRVTLLGLPAKRFPPPPGPPKYWAETIPPRQGPLPPPLNPPQSVSQSVFIGPSATKATANGDLGGGPPSTVASQLDSNTLLFCSGSTFEPRKTSEVQLGDLSEAAVTASGEGGETAASSDGDAFAARLTALTPARPTTPRRRLPTAPTTTRDLHQTD